MQCALSLGLCMYIFTIDNIDRNIGESVGYARIINMLTFFSEKKLSFVFLFFLLISGSSLLPPNPSERSDHLTFSSLDLFFLFLMNILKKCMLQICSSLYKSFLGKTHINGFLSSRTTKVMVHPPL